MKRTLLWWAWCRIKDQVVEIDFCYPSEGIHCHWDKGAQPQCLIPASAQCMLGLACMSCCAAEGTSST